MLHTLTSDLNDGVIVAVVAVDIISDARLLDDDVDIFSLFLLPPKSVMIFGNFNALDVDGAFDEIIPMPRHNFFKPSNRKFAVLASCTNTNYEMKSTKIYSF